MLQPIWKTQGQSPMLASQAFDIFVWSDFALSRLFLDNAWESRGSKIINRQMRSAARFFRFMYQMSTSHKFALSKIYHEMDFGRQTDKEFAVSGNITNRYMSASPRLLTPCLPSSVVREIILSSPLPKCHNVPFSYLPLLCLHYDEFIQNHRKIPVRKRILLMPIPNPQIISGSSARGSSATRSVCSPRLSGRYLLY